MALFDSSTCTLYTYTRVLLHCEQCFKIQCLGKHAKCSIIQRKEEKNDSTLSISGTIFDLETIFFFILLLFSLKKFLLVLHEF